MQPTIHELESYRDRENKGGGGKGRIVQTHEAPEPGVPVHAFMAGTAFKLNTRSPITHNHMRAIPTAPGSNHAFDHSPTGAYCGNYMFPSDMDDDDGLRRSDSEHGPGMQARRS